jgi:hypothetical protein
VDRVRYWNRHVTRISKKSEPSLLDLRDWLQESVEIDFNPYTVKLDIAKKDKGSSKGVYNTAVMKPKDKSAITPGNAKWVKGQSSEKSLSVKSRPNQSNSTQSRFGQNSTVVCPMCSDNHHLYRCFRFVNKRPEERKKIVKDRNLCFNCLRAHTVDQCTSSLRCREDGCGQLHHTLLHMDQAKTVKIASVNIAFENGLAQSMRGYFQLVRVFACGSNGRWIPTVALLDSASEITMLHQSLARDLGLQGKSRELTIQTMNAESTVASQVVSFKLKSAERTDLECLQVNNAWTLRANAFQCPSQRISTKWDHVKGLDLTDIDTSEVKILIGINIPAAHLQIDSRMGQENEPIAIQTPLGWSLMGVTDVNHAESIAAKVNFMLREDRSLREQIEHFWSTEAFGVSSNVDVPQSKQDKKAQKMLVESTRLSEDGHYEVGMLWKNDLLPDNKHVAIRRYHLLEKRLKGNSELKRLYTETLNGYVKKRLCKETHKT